MYIDDERVNDLSMQARNVKSYLSMCHTAKLLPLRSEHIMCLQILHAIDEDDDDAQ